MQNAVYARMIFYVLSPILATAAGLLSGYGVTYDATAQILTLDLNAVVGAVAASGALSGIVFRKWGVK